MLLFCNFLAEIIQTFRLHLIIASINMQRCTRFGTFYALGLRNITTIKELFWESKFYE